MDSSDHGAQDGSVSQVRELQNEVSIKASIDESALTIAGKSRALAALDTLIGGIIGIPAVAIEGMRRRAALRADQKERMIKAVGDKAVQIVAEDDELATAIAHRFLRDQGRKQFNREAVALEAIDALTMLPSPEKWSGDDGEAVDTDWLNMFSRYAEDASTDRVRELLGRILAGEIRGPGTFAPTTLRVIAEMDSEIAQVFQEIVKYRLPDGMIIRPEDLRNETLIKYAMMEELGLLHDIHQGMLLTYNEEDAKDGYISVVVDSMLLKIVVPEGFPPPRFTAIRISRVGQQIASILERDAELTLRKLADIIDGDYRIELRKIINFRDDDLAETTLEEVLRESP